MMSGIRVEFDVARTIKGQKELIEKLTPLFLARCDRFGSFPLGFLSLCFFRLLLLPLAVDLRGLLLKLFP